MTTSTVFATGRILTLLAWVAVVRYPSEPVRAQLRELCGNRDRAEFWTAFANVALVLASSIFAMRVDPQTEPAVPAVLAVSNPLQWGLIGLVSTVLAVGWVLSRFMDRAPVGRSPALRPNPGGAI